MYWLAFAFAPLMMEEQPVVSESGKKKTYYEVKPQCRCESCTPCVETDSIHVIYSALASEAISAYAIYDSLHDMPQNLIQYLPLGFISSYASKDVERGWHLLPNHAKKSLSIVSCRRCRKHHSHRGEGRTDVDGPNPMIKDCKMCRMEFIEIFK